MKSEFKFCSCGAYWTSPESFVRDAYIRPIGMTLAPGEDYASIYYFFNHVKCESTLAVNAEDFVKLIDEHIPSDNMAETEKCPQHCTTIGDLEICGHECRYAPFRRFLIDRILKKNI